MMFTKLILMSLILTSCASTIDMGWGKYSLARSEVTGDEIHSVSRAPVKSDTGMYIDLHKNSKSKTAVMSIYVPVPQVFTAGESLQIRVDNEVYKLKGLDPVSRSELYYNHVYSVQRYEVTKELLQKMLKGTKVYIRVDLSTIFVEGDFGYEMTEAELMGNIDAKKAFKLFIEKVWTPITSKF